MTIRVRMKTVPLAQWDVARELRKRIKRAFEEAGIQSPTSQHVVRVKRDESPPGKLEGRPASAPPRDA
jgi:moderate conductance mechanosensitive channel